MVIVLLSVILTAGIVYQTTGSKYKALLEEKDATITLTQSTGTEPQQATPVVGRTETEIACEVCHGVEQTKSFHTVKNIKLLNEAEGKTQRICTICHGSSPHNVHQKKLSDGEMQCESCHLSPDGDYIVPKAPEGMLLVCETCHPFSGQPEDAGNYVSIHITEGNRDCKICHMGDPVKVHKKATEKLGLVE